MLNRQVRLAQRSGSNPSVHTDDAVPLFIENPDNAVNGETLVWNEAQSKALWGAGGGAGGPSACREFTFSTTTRTDGTWTIIDFKNPTSDTDPNTGMSGYTSPGAFHSIDGTGKILPEAGWYSLVLSFNVSFSAAPAIVNIEWLDSGYSVDSYGRWQRYAPAGVHEQFSCGPFAMSGTDAWRGYLQWSVGPTMSGNIYLNVIQHKAGL